MEGEMVLATFSVFWLFTYYKIGLIVVSNSSSFQQETLVSFL